MSAADLERLLEEGHKDARKGGEKPLFEGERNPETGETGGPKTDPLKYGDYSFNGRGIFSFFHAIECGLWLGWFR